MDEVLCVCDREFYNKIAGGGRGGEGAGGHRLRRIIDHYKDLI